MHVSVRRDRCLECAHVWRQDMSQAADPRANLSRAAVRWALTGMVVHHVTVARIAQALGMSWNTANTAVLAKGARLLINDPGRCEGVRVIGVDEHVWRHTPYGDKYVTVIVDVTTVRDRSGPSRLLHMVPGRSKRVSSQPGSPPRPARGARALRSSQCMVSPALRAPLPKSSPARGRSWITSTLYTLPVMLSMSVVDVCSKDFTIGAGVPRIPCTRRALCSTPAHAYSRCVSNTAYSTCSPARSASHSG